MARGVRAAMRRRGGADNPAGSVSRAGGGPAHACFHSISAMHFDTNGIFLFPFVALMNVVLRVAEAARAAGGRDLDGTSATGIAGRAPG